MPSLLRSVIHRLPIRTPHSLAQRLIVRANAERDAANYQSASAFYEEALRLVPGNPRFRIQAGHMYKEAGDLAAAERHYLAALEELPDDPDLFIQLGHFYKLSDRLDDAEAAYNRALALRPGWIEAQEELVRLAIAPHGTRESGQVEALIPSLLPTVAIARPVLRQGFHVHRLGATRMWTRGRYRRVLRGIEAIRGFVIWAGTLDAVELFVDGRSLHREPLQQVPLVEGRPAGKYVFNIWFDFGRLPLGPCQIELRVVDTLGRSRHHRAEIDIVAPVGEAEALDCDGIVDASTNQAGLESEINSRLSMVRPANRSAIPKSPTAVLVQRVDQLGDLACSVPALLRLRALFPETRLVGLVTRSNLAFAQTLGIFDAIEVAEFNEEITDGRKAMTAVAQEALGRKLAAHKFDIAIDLGETGVSRPLLLLSGAPFLYGFKDRDFPWLSAGFELNAHDPANHHEMNAIPRKLLAMVEGLAAMLPADPPMLGRTVSVSEALQAHGLAADEPYALLHSGARLAYTRWPGFAALAELLLERTALSIVMMSDGPLAQLLQSPRIRNIVGHIPFSEFDGLIAGACVFVGNDSGPKHLASLRGVPVISLHMARLNWNEWGQDWQGAIVSRRVPCAGCGIGGNAEDCGKDYACLLHIGAEEVLAAVLQVAKRQ